MHTLEGTLERITFQSEDDGYTVGKLTPAGKRFQVTIVGKLAGVRPGETLHLEGEWQEHRDHGRQFGVVTCRTLMPATIDGIRRYLGSGLVKGIGPATAQKITDTFGKFTLEVIEREPDRLGEVPGLGRKKVELIKQAWREQQRIKEVMIFLQEVGLPTGMAVRIYKQYGDAAIQVVRDEPYRLADEVYGIGFLTADKIASALGLAHDDPRRIAAGLRHTLGTATEDGHSYLPAGELIRRAASLLGVDQGQVQEVLADPELAGEIEIPDEERRAKGENLPDDANGHSSLVVRPSSPVYLKPLAMAETGVAAAILRQQRAPSTMAGFYGQARWDQVFAHLQDRRDLRFTERQRDAIRTTLTQKVSVLTGGPGTGKTTVLRTIVSLVAARGYKALLASPTGRAAKRLSEVTSAEAKTIHRLLEYAPGGGGSFRRNAEWPLECDLLVVDEVSMLDILLANHLLKAVPPQAHLLLVGDADQLPSVGPGNVLRDVMVAAEDRTSAIALVRLREVFRQGEGSTIVTNAHRVLHGERPLADASGSKGEFYVVSAREPERVHELVVRMASERIPEAYGLDPVHDVQVLCPMHKGRAGTEALNVALQAQHGAGRPALEYRGGGRTTLRKFMVGDRVMQTKNDYQKGVYNGDVGIVLALDPEEDAVDVSIDGAKQRYVGKELLALRLAYAVSIHKSQGSEFPAVIIPLLTEHHVMLRRNLLYTAITRARSLCVLVGDPRAIDRAVRQVDAARRHTGLTGRLLQALADPELLERPEPAPDAEDPGELADPRGGWDEEIGPDLVDPPWLADAVPE
jgi:exodeoxyribonuclease V alpha subunit